MGRLTKWKKEDWGILVESDGGERPCMTIAIGEREVNGIKSHITEDIYQDIMECVIENDSFYRVYVNYNEMPRIVTYYDGELVAGNNQFAVMKADIIEMLKKIYLPDLVKAYLDLQKEIKATPAVEIVRNRLKEMSKGEPVLYQLMFLKPIIDEHMEKSVLRFKESPLSDLTNYELRELMLSIRYGNKLGLRRPIEIIKDLKEDEVKDLVTEEIIKRFLKGEL